MTSIDQEANSRARRLQPFVLTIEEACLVLRISKGSLYKLIRRKQLKTVRFGRRRYVPAEEIQKMINELTEQETS